MNEAMMVIQMSGNLSTSSPPAMLTPKVRSMMATHQGSQHTAKHTDTIAVMARLFLLARDSSTACHVIGIW